MLTDLILAVLLLAGVALYAGRYRWRWRWDRLLIISVAFQAAGFLLIAPFLQDDWISRWSENLTGMGLLPDLIGHFCFISAIDAMAMAVAYRLMPHPGCLRKYIENPSAAAAGLMLATFTLSDTTRGTPHCNDFFACPMDTWLRIYWIIFGLICTYLMAIMIYMLLAIRREYPESQLTVNIYMSATVIGAIDSATLIVQGVTGQTVPEQWRWIPFCVASGLSLVAGSLTLARSRV